MKPRTRTGTEYHICRHYTVRRIKVFHGTHRSSNFCIYLFEDNKSPYSKTPYDMRRKCPYCFEYMQSSASKCRHCRRELKSSTVNTRQSWTESHSKTRAKNDHSVHPVTGEPLRPRPTSYLVWAILATVFCCLPFGIVSIVYAAKVDNAYNMGLIAESYRLSKNARTWMIVSAVVGFISGLSYFLIVIAAASFA